MDKRSSLTKHRQRSTKVRAKGTDPVWSQVCSGPQRGGRKQVSGKGQERVKVEANTDGFAGAEKLKVPPTSQICPLWIRKRVFEQKVQTADAGSWRKTREVESHSLVEGNS